MKKEKPALHLTETWLAKIHSKLQGNGLEKMEANVFGQEALKYEVTENIYKQTDERSLISPLFL